jgi:hypothetical protein
MCSLDFDVDRVEIESVLVW